MTTTAPHRRLIAWLIGIALVTFTLLQNVTFPNLGGAGLRLPFNATVWMGFAVMMALAMWPAARGVIRFGTFHKGLGLLLLALWLPFLWSWNEASLIALPRMLGVTAGAILLLGLAQLELTRRDWWWLGMAILLGALVQAVLGYVQLYVLEPGNWLGFDPDSTRPYGIFQQVNVMASFLVTGLAVSAWLCGEARNRLESGVTLAAPLLMPALILLIQSRTGWLAALIVAPLLLAHLWHRDRARLRAWGAMLAAGVALAALLWWAPWAEQGVAAKAVGNPGERLPVYLHSLRMILEEPLTGWGYGRFQHDFLFSFADWRAALPVNQPEIVDPIITQTYSHPHNELLLWGVEGGLLPMLAIIAFAGWLAWRLWTHGARGERLLLAALLLPLTLHAMTEYPFYHSIGHWLTFLLLVGLVASRCWQTKQRENRYTFGIRVGAYVAVPVLVVFMGTHLLALHTIKQNASGKREVIDMRGIINPLGVPNLIANLNRQLNLNNALASDDKHAIEQIVTDFDSELQKRPAPEKFDNLLKALSSVQEETQEREKRRLKKHLFPSR